MNELVIALPVFAIWIMVGSTVINRQPAEVRSLLWTSLLAHLASGVAMVLVTNYYYGGGDMISYATVGRFLADRLTADFFGLAPKLVGAILHSSEPLPIPGLGMNIMVGSNTGSMQAVSGFIMLACGNSLYAACLMIAGANFLAKLAILRAMRLQLPDVPYKPVCIACLLVPSAVFWSSGMIKEALAVIGLAMMVSGGTSMAVQQRFVWGAVLLGLGAYAVWLFKAYLLPPFGIGAGLWFAARAVRSRGRDVEIQTRYLVVGAVVAITLTLMTGAFLPSLSPDAFEEEAQNAQLLGARIAGGSTYSLGGGSVVSQVPLAIITSLFRPSLIDVSSVMVFFNAVEMTWITVLALQVISRSSPLQNLRQIMARPPLAFCLGFVLTLSVGVGLTTVNLGTLSRYRMPLIPFYVLLLSVLAARRAPVPSYDLRAGTAPRPERDLSHV
jgi:hypothetical protein